MAKFQMSKSVEINRSAEAIFQYLSDISQVGSWRPNVTIKEYSGDPFGIGSTWDDVTTFLGRDMVTKTEVTAVEPGRGYTMKQETNGFAGYATWTITPGSGDSCTATLSFEGETSGWMAGLASGLIRNQAQQSMERDLGNLKANLEAG